MSSEPELAAKPDDFVGHLRLVNFTLLVASIGLFMAVMQPTASEYERASNDLTHVLAIADEPFPQQFMGYADKVARGARASALGEKPTLYVPVFSNDGPVLARLSKKLLYVFPQGLRAKPSAPGPGGEPPPVDVSRLLPEGHTKIETLEDFSRVWNEFQDHPASLWAPQKLGAGVQAGAEPGTLPFTPPPEGLDAPRQPANMSLLPAAVFTTHPDMPAVSAWDLGERPVLRSAGDAPKDGVSAAALLASRQTLYAGATEAPPDPQAEAKVVIQPWDEKLTMAKHVVDPGVEAIEALAVSPNGKLLACFRAPSDTFAPTDNLSIELWDLPDLPEKEKRSTERPTVYKARPVLAFSPDSERLLFTAGAKDQFGEDHLQLVNTKNLEPVDGFEAPPAPYEAAAFSPDGRMIVAASYDAAKEQEEIVLLDAKTGKKQSVIGAHKTFVTGLVFLPDGATVASASHDGSVRVWPTKPGAKENVHWKDGPPTTALAISANGKTLAAAGFDMRLRVWDVNNLGSPRIDVLHGGVPGYLGLTEDAKRIFCAGRPLPDVELQNAWFEDGGAPGASC